MATLGVSVNEADPGSLRDPAFDPTMLLHRISPRSTELRAGVGHTVDAEEAGKRRALLWPRMRGTGAPVAHAWMPAFWRREPRNENVVRRDAYVNSR